MIKHSKYKNSGIIFELLARQITSDILSNKTSPAIHIIKKYFTNTELEKEYRLYEALSKNKSLSESKANTVLSSLIESFNNVDYNKVKSEKHNLIKEIKNHYDLDKFFKIKFPNYKLYASFYTLLESNRKNKNNSHLNQIIENKNTILECLIKSDNLVNKNDLFLKEFQSYDRDIRILTYKILLEKFNKKYDGLSQPQKSLLKEFINIPDSPPKLKEFYNKHLMKIKPQLEEYLSKIEDKATKIKIQGVLTLMEELKPQDKVKTNLLTNLIQYNELLSELELLNE